MIKRVVAAALVAASLLGVAPVAAAEGAAPTGVAAPQEYKFDHTDTFAFWDASGNSVWTQGYVDWYYDGWFAPVARGQYRDRVTSYVILNRSGCLWVQISFSTFTATVSWPPSGGSSTTSDGFYTYCGSRGAWVDVGGVAYASRTLHSTTICIGYSNYGSSVNIRAYTSCHKMRGGG